MSKLSTMTPIAAVLAVSVAGFAHAAENPFAIKPVAGIVLASAVAEGKCGATKEGKCGEGKCGAEKKAAMMKEGKCGEGKCGAEKKAAADAAAAKAAKEGKCGADKAAMEGKCGADKAKEAAVPAAK